MSDIAQEVIEAASIQSLLAHRFPFLLVDRIRVVEAGRYVVGTKRVSAGEWWGGADTPPDIEMPFSLVIEALAQTTSALLRDLTEGATGTIAYFMGADRVRLRRPARAGDELELAVTLLQWRRGICRTRGVATVNGEFVASAVLTIVVRGRG